MDKSVVNAILVARRKVKKLNQGQMAAKLNWNQRTFQRKEAGNCSFDELNEICKVLDLKLVIIPNEILT